MGRVGRRKFVQVPGQGTVAEHKDIRPLSRRQSVQHRLVITSGVHLRIFHRHVRSDLPVSGEEINDQTKATYEYKGKIYNFCCPMCIEEFKKDPEKYIEKMKKDTMEKEPMKEESMKEESQM